MADSGMDEKLKIAAERLKMSRIWVFVLGGLQLGIGIYQWIAVPDKYLANIGLLTDGGLGICFLALAWYSYQKPALAFFTALLLYLMLNAIIGYLNPSFLFNGVLIKALILMLLMKAFTNGRTYTKLKTGEA